MHLEEDECKQVQLNRRDSLNHLLSLKNVFTDEEKWEKLKEIYNRNRGPREPEKDRDKMIDKLIKNNSWVLLTDKDT